MPTFVHTEKCDGCKGGSVTACMYICPNDLMKLDIARMKAYNQEPDQCWECQSCVKACPQQAVEVRSFQDWVPMGATTRLHGRSAFATARSSSSSSRPARPRSARLILTPANPRQAIWTAS